MPDIPLSTVVSQPPQSPVLVSAEAIVWSKGKTSLFLDPEAGKLLNDPANLKKFFGDPQLMIDAVKKLKDKGFTVLSAGNFGIIIQAPAEVYQDSFNVTVHTDDPDGRITVTAASGNARDVFINTESSAEFKDLLARILLSPPLKYHEELPDPPQGDIAYSDGSLYLTPDMIKKHLQANPRKELDLRFRTSSQGQGVSVTLVDTGFFLDHPYLKKIYPPEEFARPNSEILNDTRSDNSGHGTQVVATLLSVAGKINLRLFNDFNRFKEHGEVQTFEQFVEVKKRSPTDRDPVDGIYSISVNTTFNTAPYKARIQTSLSRNNIWVCSIGNKGDILGEFWQNPIQDLISVGGAYWTAAGTLQASNFTLGSGGPVSLPDVCGLCGDEMMSYLVLPVPEKSHWAGLPQDRFNQRIRGWIYVRGGSSMATPQVAGVCALIKQICPGISPADMKKVLKDTAVKITNGTTGNNVEMRTIGAGLVNLPAAFSRAQTRFFSLQNQQVTRRQYLTEDKQQELDQSLEDLQDNPAFDMAEFLDNN